jgi:hypothetical protein
MPNQVFFLDHKQVNKTFEDRDGVIQSGISALTENYDKIPDPGLAVNRFDNSLVRAIIIMVLLLPGPPFIQSSCVVTIPPAAKIWAFEDPRVATPEQSVIFRFNSILVFPRICNSKIAEVALIYVSAIPEMDGPVDLNRISVCRITLEKPLHRIRISM